MTRRRTRRAPANPLLAWAGLVFRTGEMMMASSQVIGHRTGRMANAGLIPNARDQKEFTRMGQEKFEAAAESMQAMTMQVIRANQQMGMLATQQMMGAASGFMALAMAPTVALSGKRQAELLRNAMKNSAAATSQLSGSVARVWHYGLVPVHSRATGNAQRLLKPKKR